MIAYGSRSVKVRVFARTTDINRAGGGIVNNNNNNARRSVKSIVIEPSSDQIDPEKIRVSTSPRQVHPVSDKMSPAPNICVQGGRIEFIKPNDPRLDPIKERLEARITELEALLEEEKKSTLKERRNTARYQALLQERECLSRDVSDAKLAKDEALQRLAQARQQAEGTNKRVSSLQHTVSRLEESLRTMSTYKTQYIQLLVENEALKKSIEGRVHKFQSALSRLSAENEALRSQLNSLQSSDSQMLSEKLRVAEEENARLLVERDKCEKCLDQVAHQVVQALLSQKGLQEIISSLRDKVKELEKQNYTLSSLLLQQMPKTQPNKLQANPQVEVCVRPLSCDEGKLKWRADSLFWLPIHRPSSLNLESQRALLTGTGGLITSVESHKDEGYSTMSSEVQCEGGTTTSQGPLERLQEETTNRLDEDLVVGLRVTRHSAIPRSSSDSALLPYSTLGDEQEWWDPDSTLSRIEFDAPPELEEWNMDDIPGLSFLAEDLEDIWFSVIDSQYGLISPGADSWSSHTTTSEESKRSSGAESETPAVGTHFTRDFYRLVKFESTKSLASTSSRSQVSESGGRETLQSVLQFIAEQQQYSEEPLEIEASPELPPESLPSLTPGQSSGDDAPKPGTESWGLLTVPEETEEAEVVPPCRDELSPLAQANTLEELHKIVSESDTSAGVEEEALDQVQPQEECTSKSTGWVHLNRPADLNDPKMRANLFDAVSSRSSSSCSGSSESGDDHSPYQHLHRLHRSRQHKKASASRDGALRLHLTPRVSIIGREDIFTRFGAKEQEAVASFDFLEEINTNSRDSTVARPSPQ